MYLHIYYIGDILSCLNLLNQCRSKFKKFVGAQAKMNLNNPQLTLAISSGPRILGGSITSSELVVCCDFNLVELIFLFTFCCIFKNNNFNLNKYFFRVTTGKP